MKLTYLNSYLESEPEEEESVELPVERNLSYYQSLRVSPELIEIPLTQDAEQSVGPETVVSSVFEPLNFDLTPDLVEPETGPRRSVRQRLLPKRLQYS